MPHNAATFQSALLDPFGPSNLRQNRERETQTTKVKRMIVVRELSCADGRRNANEAAAADLKVDDPIQKGPCIWHRCRALGEQSWGCCSTKCQIICAFGKVAAKLIMAEVCLNRSWSRRSSCLNRDFDRPEQKVSRHQGATICGIQFSRPGAGARKTRL